MEKHIFEKVKKCNICNSSKLKFILDLGNQPPANSLRKEFKCNLSLIPLQLFICLDCKTAQLGHVVNEKLLFSNYYWVTATSLTALKHSKLFYDELIKRIKIKKLNVLEIASNDGTFLKPFKAGGHDVLGIDPAKNIAKIANEQDIKTLSKFFSQDLVSSKVELINKFDVVFARNVLPHVKKIHSVIKGIELCLKKDGICAIEFHDASIILKELHYDSIYHEHLFYFSINTITDLFKRYNLYAFDIFKSPISGGSWVIYFSKIKKKKSNRILYQLQKENNSKINEISAWVSFAKNSIKHSKKLKNLVNLNKTKVIGYGASARSSTLLNFCKIDHKVIEYIIDKNPLKHNMFTPGTNIKIVSPEYFKKDMINVKIIIILAWNFESEIILELNKLGYKGKIITPLPKEIKFYEI